METEGPYRHSTKGGKCVASCVACVYAEGRKAAEKDFKELLELLNKFRSAVWWNGGLEWVVEFEDAFDAWKKARGIE